jgi:hypothetical protein
VLVNETSFGNGVPWKVEPVCYARMREAGQEDRADHTPVPISPTFTHSIILTTHRYNNH